MNKRDLWNQSVVGFFFSIYKFYYVITILSNISGK